MCEFISWVEHTKTRRIYYLTGKDLASNRGAELKKHDPCEDNWKGHGAIYWFYGLDSKDFIEKECTDFSTPDNFPQQIVTDIKLGKFRGVGASEQLLTDSALAEYKQIQGPAWAEYYRIKDQAWAEYKRIKDPALAEYKRIQGQASAEYDRIKDQAWAEYERIQGPAWAEYERRKNKIFGDLFSNPENRAVNWR